MRAKSLKYRKTIFLSIIFSFILTISLTFSIFSVYDSPVTHQTKIGEINISSLNMTDEEILWHGYPVVFLPNESFSFEGVKYTKEQVVDVGPWTYEANRYGLRGSISDTKPDYRIVILGGSNTYQGLNHSQTFSYKLEKKLTKNLNQEVEVINAGTPNSGVMDYYLFLTTLGNRLEPDLVIVSDITDGMNVPRAQRSKIDRKVWNKIDEKGIENAYVLQNNISHTIEVEYFRNEELSENRRITEYLEKIDQHAEDNEYKFLLSCGIHEICMDIGQWATENRINFIGKPQQFKDNPLHRYQLPDTHMNEEGHSIYAEHLHYFVGKNLPE